MFLFQISYMAPLIPTCKIEIILYQKSGEEQIYYMLVDENSGLDGAALENQTMFIDEAQLTAAGARPGNVIIQVMLLLFYCDNLILILECTYLA